jgi:hypothetical protein
MYKVQTQTRGVLYFTKLPKGTYFGTGYHEGEKGKAFYFTYDTGTCLIPITDLNGNEIFDISRAGEEIN